MIRRIVRGSIFVSLVLVAFVSVVLIEHHDFIRPWYCAHRESPNERSECLIPYFESLTRERSATYAIEEALMMQRSGAIDDCHVAAHAIGAENLRVHENDPAQAFAACPMGCVDGCNHGVMEAYVELKGTEELSIPELISLCDSVGTDETMKRQCIHGVGHGILRHQGAVRDAIAACNGFPDDYARTTCKGGVFMQNAQNAIDHDDASTIENMRGACSTLDPSEPEYRICTEAIGPALMFYTGHDLERTKELCAQLDAPLIEQCVTHATLEKELHESILKEQ